MLFETRCRGELFLLDAAALAISSMAQVRGEIEERVDCSTRGILLVLVLVLLKIFFFARVPSTELIMVFFLFFCVGFRSALHKA